MKVANKKKKDNTFKSLEAGDAFYFTSDHYFASDHGIWMKLCDDWSDQAVRLSDGLVAYVEPETQIQIAVGEFVIKG
jgi:hypothetical protein